MVRVEESDSRDERRRAETDERQAADATAAEAEAGAGAAGEDLPSPAGALAATEQEFGVPTGVADDIPRPVTVETVGDPAVTVEPASDAANMRADLEGAGDEDEPTGR